MIHPASSGAGGAAPIGTTGVNAAATRSSELGPATPMPAMMPTIRPILSARGSRAARLGCGGPTRSRARCAAIRARCACQRRLAVAPVMAGRSAMAASGRWTRWFVSSSQRSAAGRVGKEKRARLRPASAAVPAASRTSSTRCGQGGSSQTRPKSAAATNRPMTPSGGQSSGQRRSKASTSRAARRCRSSRAVPSAGGCTKPPSFKDQPSRLAYVGPLP